MGTTADKLQAILNSKRAIKEALIAKGAAITDQTKFSQYAAVISQMSTGSSDIGDAYVVVEEEDGVLKAQKLSLEGTTATPEGATETIDNVGLFATGMAEPSYNGGGTGGTMKFYKCASVVAPQPQEPQAAQPYFVVQNAVTYPDLNGIYKYAGEYNNDYGNCPLYILQGTTNILYYHNTDQAWYISPSLVINHQDKTFAGEYPYYKADANTDATQLSLTEFRNFESQPDITCKKYVPSVQPEEVPKTWSGYELVLSEGNYSISSEITTGLKYTSIIPVKDSIYSEDALIKVAFYAQKMPEEGLVFYAPLSEASATAATGQVLTEVNYDANQWQLKYGSEDGIPCAIFADAYYGADSAWSGLTFDASTLPQGAEPRTISMWVKIYNNSAGIFFAYGSYSRGNSFYFGYNNNYKTINFSCHGDDVHSVDSFDFSDRLHHLAVVLDGNTNRDITMYFDGVRQNMAVVNDIGINTSGNTCRIGCGTTNGYGRFDGWLSSIRVYDRVLGEDEIIALANEFTPTA